MKIAEIFDPATRYEYELPLPADIARAPELDARFGELGRGLVDGMVAAIAERRQVYRVLTTDRRDFSAIRVGPRLTRALELLPWPGFSLEKSWLKYVRKLTDDESRTRASAPIVSPSRRLIMKPDLFKTKLLALALLAGGSLFAAPAVAVGIEIGAPPPPPRAYYARPPAPGPNHVWISGFYEPVGGEYRWREPYWAPRPYAHAAWVAPRYRGHRY
jgi:hypothetical protein